MSSFPSRAPENGKKKKKNHSRAWFWSRPAGPAPMFQHVPLHFPGPDHDHVLDTPSYVWPPEQSTGKWKKPIPEHGLGAAPARPAPMFQHLLLHIPDPDHHPISRHRFLSQSWLFRGIPKDSYRFLPDCLAMSSFPSRAPENGKTHSRAWFCTAPPAGPAPMFQHVPLHFPGPDHPRSHS